ncbi:hypothetical protein RRG08_009379 [Elysia crispata]|uniref:Uncharacterized protein n=1 Tax=Elysia crispata TaxID=231223 RepID=A0AAE1DZD5_9GAST|nr:hypothetical protein RRG08_009379 [Elysia crispata]
MRDVSATCTDDGFKVVDSCPPEPVETSTEGTGDDDGNFMSGRSGSNNNMLALRTGLDSTGDEDTVGIGNTNTNNNNITTNTSSHNDTSQAVGDNNLGNDDGDSINSNSSSSSSSSSAGRSRFSDNLVVTDPTTGIVYANQSVMACNRNVTARLSKTAAALTYATPIFWNRRMFVEATVAQPQQAVVIDDNTVISWKDYPPADITPRYCAKRFQLSCFRYLDEPKCWFLTPDSMEEFCDEVRGAFTTIQEAGGYISDTLLELYPKPAVDEWEISVPHDLPEPNNPSNESSGDTGDQFVEFPEYNQSDSCTLRKFKGDVRTIRTSISFSLTMALDQETGVFVVSHEDTFSVKWEQIQCRMEENDALAEPICDRVLCSDGYFYAPGKAATSACLKPDMLEVSFIFRGVDSATLARTLDLIRAATVYYGPGMSVEALGGFVHTERGDMAYTDMYRIQNISIADSSDRIPSTLALVESLSQLDVTDRTRFPESIQLCFEFREMSTEVAEDATSASDDDQGNVLFTQQESVMSRCDVVYLHDRSVRSISLHRSEPLKRATEEEITRTLFTENGAYAHDKESNGRLLMLAAAALLGVLKVLKIPDAPYAL